MRKTKTESEKHKNEKPAAKATGKLFVFRSGYSFLCFSLSALDHSSYSRIDSSRPCRFRYVLGVVPHPSERHQFRRIE